MHQFIITLFLLLGWHALADFPLQGQYLSEAKNRNTTTGRYVWKWALFMHGLIHGLGVYLITGSFPLALVEVIVHIRVDYLKCENALTFNQDQSVHVFFKVIYALAMVMAL